MGIINLIFARTGPAILGGAFSATALGFAAGGIGALAYNIPLLLALTYLVVRADQEVE